MEGRPLVTWRSLLPALTPPSRVIVGRGRGRMQSARPDEKTLKPPEATIPCCRRIVPFRRPPSDTSSGRDC